MPFDPLRALAALAAVFVVSRILKLWNGIRETAFIPGIRCAFDPLDFPGGLLPSSWWNPGVDAIWVRRFSMYKKYGNDTISIVPFLVGHSQLYTANLDVARQVVGSGVKGSWLKPERVSRSMMFWGTNLIAADRDVWRRHRRIMGPAFNNQTNQLVWERTAEIYREWMDTADWKTKDTIDVPQIQEHTFKVALLVIAACGFGVNFSWSEPPKAEGAEGEQMSVQDALRFVAETSSMAGVLPKWITRLPLRIMDKIRISHGHLERFMHQQIAERKEELHDDDGRRADVFSHMIRANEAEEGSKLTLQDSELLANVYGLLVAGHETTAHTFAATLGLLSVHPDIQEEVHAQIMEVIGKDREPTMEDSDKLDKVVAAFYEALRLFPAGALMIREATEDTVLNIPNPPEIGGTKAVPLRKGSQVAVDMVGVQYNPRHFSEPEQYKPSRWYGSKDVATSEVFTAFSIGPRACIGRKFATVEATSFLSRFLRDWRVEPLLAPGESVQAWRARVLEARMVFTLAVNDVPLRVIRRHH